MDKLILAKDLQTANELIQQGCKLLSEQDGIYTLVNCSDKLNYNDYKDRVILTNRLNF